ncbi:hypothetical protein TorRG33x02_337730 [Trema orientale]|uniref:Uncharacterized protein n=1 Tax=Trema orientale TaxID=63057 RepID=A0A2P5AYK4_TREOI|nr:hypothetical protein TorRG33x02_337730 [Trema orientale]
MQVFKHLSNDMKQHEIAHLGSNRRISRHTFHELQNKVNNDREKDTNSSNLGQLDFFVTMKLHFSKNGGFEDTVKIFSVVSEIFEEKLGANTPVTKSWHCSVFVIKYAKFLMSDKPISKNNFRIH